MLYNKIYNFSDRLEDKVRGKLSHFPIIYAFIGGTGIVIFWRGIWHTADYLMELFFAVADSVTSTSTPQLPWWDGPLSILIGTSLLLIAGLFVTSFIGNEIIISGLKRSKKMTEKTAEEISLESREKENLKQEIHDMDKRLKHIEKILDNRS